MRLDGVDDVSQQRVARRVALTVVDQLEPVDIHVGQHEPTVPVPRSIDLVLERNRPELTPQSTGELIDLRMLQLGSCLLAILHRGGSLRRCRHAIGRGGPTVGGGVISV